MCLFVYAIKIAFFFFASFVFIGIFAATKEGFKKLGGDCNWLEKVTAMTADGASVNLGHRSGVITHVQEEAGGHVVPFHCMPHR